MPAPFLTASVTVWCAQPLATGVGATAWLPSDEAARAAAFRQEADRSRFVTGRALARAALGDRLGISPTDVVIRLGPRDGPAPGRPFVDGAPSFSIAHAGSWVLVAVVDAVTGPVGAWAGAGAGAGATVHVGVDVESTSPAQDHLADLLDAVPVQERPGDGWGAESFTRSWVRREAVLKAVGTGLLAPRDDLILSPADHPAAVVRSGGVLPGRDRLVVQDLELPAAPPAVDRSSSSSGTACLAAVALCSPRGTVELSGVELADGSGLLTRHGLGEP